ncbi:hypothetical protein MASR2M70_19440 [Bacillota bacterium]
MKKFQFHMEKLLSYKEQILDSEMMNLAVLNSLLKNAVETLKSMEEERERYKEEFEVKMREQITSADCGMYASYDKHIKGQIKICETEILNIENQIEEQIERVKNLKMETKSLETIKESRFMEYKKEELKQEEQFIDEFVSGSRLMEKVH